MASRVVLQDEFLTFLYIESKRKGKWSTAVEKNVTQGDADAITGRIVVQIGNVTVPLDPSPNPEMIPRGYFFVWT